MRKTALWAVLVATLLCVPSSRVWAQYVGTEDLLGMELVEPDYVLSYGPDELQFGHLRVPEGEGPFPVLVVIHGGCWLSFADLQHMTPFAAEFAAASSWGRSW